MDPSQLADLVSVVAQLGAAAIRASARDPSVVGPAIETTCRQFPRVVAEPALEQWVETESFEAVITRLRDGERDLVNDEVIGAFIQESGFFLHDDDSTRATTEQLLSVFLAALLTNLLRGAEGIPTLANRLEQRHAETEDAITARITQMETRLLAQSQRTPAISLAASPDDDAQTDPELARISVEIDAARKLSKEGNVVSARALLEQTKRTAGDIPEDLEFRLVTNLGGCAVEVGDIEGGCALLQRALQLRPNDPMALANAAAVAGLEGKPQQAAGLARRSLEAEPRDPHATSVLMASLAEAREFEQLDELVAEEPWIVNEPESGVTLAVIRTDQDRFDEALGISRGLVDGAPESHNARSVLAWSLLVASQSEPGDSRLEWCREAERQSTSALELLETTELQERRLQALSIRAGARMMLGSFEAAMNDFEAILRDVPDDPGTLYNKGLALLDMDDFSGARAALARITDPERRAKALLPHASACYGSGDAAAAADLLRGEFSLDRGEWGDIRKAELLCELEVALGSDDSIGPLLERALKQRPDDPRLLGLAATHGDFRGPRDDAEILLLRALEIASDSDRHEFSRRLAYLYGRHERYSDAADQYVEIVNSDVLHPAAMPLLSSLRNSGRLREALVWARATREGHPRPPKFALETEAQILNHVGDVAAATERWSGICSRDDATMVDQVNLAQALFWCGRRETALSAARKADASELRTEPRQLLRLAQLKRLLGEADYLDDAYVARREAPGDPAVHLGYFGLFMSQGEETDPPATVEPGCAVLLRDESGKEWWLILEHGDEGRSERDLQPGAALAEALRGRHRGETVALQAGVGERSVEVTDIQTKYVRAFQETASDFSKRFPGNADLSSVPVDGTDFTPIFGLADQRDRFGREVQRLYRGDQVPFAFVCARLGVPAPEAWRACIEAGDVRIRFGAGTESEAERSGGTLRCSDAVVLDTLALLTVHALGIAEHLRRRFARVAVPQAVLDAIRELVHEKSLGPRPMGSLHRNIDGSYVLIEMTDEEWGKQQEFARSLLALADSLDPIAAYPSLDVEASHLESLAGALTTAGVGAIFAGDAAPDLRPTLVSDDLGLAEIARAYGARAVNSQAALRELRRAGILTDEEYSSLIAQLAQLNYRFVQVEAVDILRLLEGNGYSMDKSASALVATLRGPECHQDSAVSIVTELIASLAVRGLPARQEGLLVSRLLMELHRGRELRRALWECREALRLRLALTPLVGARVIADVDLCIRVLFGGGE